MQDRPTANQLIDAVRQHLETALLPTITDPRLRFQTLIAAHVLGIVGRELELGDAQQAAEWSRLSALLGADHDLPGGSVERATGLANRTAHLCDLIDGGAFDAPSDRDRLLAHLEQTAIEKLQVANPRYLARIQADRSVERHGEAKPATLEETGR